MIPYSNHFKKMKVFKGSFLGYYADINSLQFKDCKYIKVYILFKNLMLINNGERVCDK